MIFHCIACRYPFERPTIPARCPDCDKFAVRLATQAEISEYERIRLEIEEEDKLPM